MAANSDSSAPQPANTDSSPATNGHAAPDTAFETVSKNRGAGSPIDKAHLPPTFEDKYQERKYLKERLALAFRIFARLGFDEGVAGHITLRVRDGPEFKQETGAVNGRMLLILDIRTRLTPHVSGLTPLVLRGRFLKPPI